MSLCDWSLIALLKKMAKPPPLFQKENLVPLIQKVPKKFEIFPAPNSKIRKKTLASTNKLWLEGVYITENTDANTNYQEVLRVGDQKWETVEIKIGIFFCLRLVFTIFYLLAPIITQGGTNYESLYLNSQNLLFCCGYSINSSPYISK